MVVLPSIYQLNTLLSFQLHFCTFQRQPDKSKKKADVAEHPEVFDHVGLLVNRLPGLAGLPFI
jgi:hypothetical protein